jgi:hypothetical protein
MKIIKSFQELYETEETPEFMANEQFQRGLDELANRVRNEIQTIWTREDTDENKLGDCGELFTDYGIKWTMANKLYFQEDILDRYCSYKITTHYKAERYSPRGGIDIYLEVKDDLGILHNFAIEVKNWHRYDFDADNLFLKDVPSRFTVCNKNDIRVLVIPDLNDYKGMCINLGIHLLSIPSCIGIGSSYESIRNALNVFCRRFNKMIEEEIYDRNNTVKQLHQAWIDVDLISKAVRLTRQQIYRILKE